VCRTLIEDTFEAVKFMMDYYYTKCEPIILMFVYIGCIILDMSCATSNHTHDYTVGLYNHCTCNYTVNTISSYWAIDKHSTKPQYNEH